MSPGAAAQRRANTAALLGEQAPPSINEIAGLPFVEPKAQAQASGTIQASRFGRE